MTSGLRTEVRVCRGEFTLDVELQVGLGEVLVVLGGPGSGKSLLVGAIAGLLQPDAGRVSLDGRVLSDVAAGVHVPAQRRPIGVLDSRPLLFPEVSVLQNVAFGPRLARVGPRQAEEEAWRRLIDVDAVALADRWVSELTAEQAQRVALARALATNPDLLLLDEPFSALDARFAPPLRTLLRSLLWDQVSVVMTGQLLDALTLADRVIALQAGRIVDERRYWRC